jgi:hypothetical protein
MTRGILALTVAPLVMAVRFPYAGVNLAPDGDWKLALPLLREAGFARLRLPINWEAIERSPGKSSYDALDSVVKEARPLGLDITGVVTLENAAYPEANRASARLQFVASVAARFRGLIGTYEIGNHPDAVTVAAGAEASSAALARSYALAFPSLAAVIRYQDPGARVVIGSFHPHNEVFFRILREMGALQAGDGVSLALSFSRDDIESADAWRGLNSRISAVQGALGRRQALTAGWVTVAGERTATERAAWFARLAVTLPALGFDAFHLAPVADLRDDLLTGLLGPTGTPRPAFTLLRNLFAVIADWRPMPAPFRYNIVFPQMYAGRSASVYYGNGVEGGVIYWNPGTQADGYLSVSPRAFFIHQMIDPIGATTKVSPETTSDGWLLKNVPPGDHPRIIRIRSSDYAFLYPAEEELPIVFSPLP